MNVVFGDTSWFLAVVGPRDRHHKAAVRFLQSWSGRIVTTEYVLIELGNRLARSADRPAFLHTLRVIRATSTIKVVPATTQWLDAGVELFSRRLDKDWSITDCISMAVMRRNDLTDVPTADHHFEQAGFKCLLDG